MDEPLADVDDIPEGKSIVIMLSDDSEVALFKIQGEIFALDNSCPHKGGPLGEGFVEGFRVSCPWHGWEFDIPTGDCINMPGESAQKIAIKIVGNKIFLDRD